MAPTSLENKIQHLSSDVAEAHLPVYVYNIQNDDTFIPLDRKHQALGFDDMVLAVRSKPGRFTVDFQCQDEVLTMDYSVIDRPVFSALLHSIWGVAGAHEMYSMEHNKTLSDHTWAAISSPFGPFSKSVDLSFASRDSAMRNVIFTALNQSLHEASLLFEHFGRYGKTVKEVMDEADLLTFRRRWNLYKHKLDKANSFLSLLNHNTAMFYARALQHDLHAMHDLVDKAAASLHTYVGCNQVVRAPFWRYVWLFVLMAAAAMSGGVWWWRQMSLPKPKRSHIN